jgi:hypothetical protein
VCCKHPCRWCSTSLRHTVHCALFGMHVIVHTAARLCCILHTAMTHRFISHALTSARPLQLLHCVTSPAHHCLLNDTPCTTPRFSKPIRAPGCCHHQHDSTAVWQGLRTETIRHVQPLGPAAVDVEGAAASNRRWWTVHRQGDVYGVHLWPNVRRDLERGVWRHVVLLRAIQHVAASVTHVRTQPYLNIVVVVNIANLVFAAHAR